MKAIIPLLLILFVSCKKDDRSITYTVDCAGCVVSYSDARGNMVPQFTVSDHWSTGITIPHDGEARLEAIHQVDSLPATYITLTSDGRKREGSETTHGRKVILIDR